jgi:hypothetical protein
MNHIATQTHFDIIEHEADLCVVGGGIAGLCAAVAAARNGSRVILMQDRAVLGGNASSEVRMWICGARGPDHKEAGILEEIMLDNTCRNPSLNYPIWDTVLYEKARFQPGLTLLLSCSCNDVTMDGDRIASVRGWQLNTQTWHVVKARYFADCSGDSALRISGAEFRWGRESRHEFGESHAPAVADRKTMGNSILIQLREIPAGQHRPFIPPAWAIQYDESNLPNRPLQPEGHNFWWLEVGGAGDTIADTETNRDELLKIACGIWAYIKNHPDGRGHRWELEWIGSLPGKRENVRYVGDHILTQNDILAGGPFEDIVAYGGWPMDDHHPDAIHHPGQPTIFHKAPSPYGIPYRSLYSRNIGNLFFAGRNISATHIALSSTRVMGTCALLGQAAGTAAAVAARYGVSPRGVYERHLRELQERLMDDDSWLPGRKRPIPEICQEAQLFASAGDAEPLRNGIDRTLGQEDNGWWAPPGESVTYYFGSPTKLNTVRLLFDSDLRNLKRMPCSYPLGGHDMKIPGMMTRAFDLEILDSAGQWQVARRVTENHQRLVKIPLEVKTAGLRFTPRASWGGERVHLFGFDAR